MQCGRRDCFGKALLKQIQQKNDRMKLPKLNKKEREWCWRKKVYSSRTEMLCIVIKKYQVIHIKKSSTLFYWNGPLQHIKREKYRTKHNSETKHRKNKYNLKNFKARFSKRILEAMNMCRDFRKRDGRPAGKKQFWKRKSVSPNRRWKSNEIVVFEAENFGFWNQTPRFPCQPQMEALCFFYNVKLNPKVIFYLNKKCHGLHKNHTTSSGSIPDTLHPSVAFFQ